MEHETLKTKKIIGYVGLGKMGLNMTKRLVTKGWKVIAYDPNETARNEARKNGIISVNSISEMVELIPKSRTIFIMVPHKIVASVIDELKNILSKNDLIIEGGNSYFEDSIKYYKSLKRMGLFFLDAGISGGPNGALNGACVMVGGDKPAFKGAENLFKDISLPNGYLYAGKSGSGHFAKMIHNGIEYGMMQSIAEGFAILKKSSFKYDLEKLTNLYNTGSVIESRLVGWLSDAYKIYGRDLKKISGIVAHTGEGDWTVQIAKKMKINTPAINEALKFRKNSHKNSSDYTGKILSALRNRFGGHKAGNK